MEGIFSTPKYVYGFIIIDALGIAGIKIKFADIYRRCQANLWTTEVNETSQRKSTPPTVKQGGWDQDICDSHIVMLFFESLGRFIDNELFENSVTNSA